MKYLYLAVLIFYFSGISIQGQTLQRAVQEINQGQFDQAIKLLKELVRKSPQDKALPEWIGYTYLRNGDIKDAIPWLEKAVHFNPNSQKMWTNLAYAYMATHQYKLALAAYQKILTFNEKSAPTWYNIGNLHDFFKDYKSAIFAFKKAVTFDPTFAFAYFNLGKAYQQERNFKEAAKMMVKAYELMPEEALFSKTAAYSYLRANDRYNALPYYESLETHTLHYGPFLIQLSSLYYDVRRFTDALKLLERFINIQTHDSSYWFNLALVQNQNNLLSQAELSYQKALGLNPHNLMAMRNYAILLYRDRKYAEALPWLRKLIALYPNETSWKQMLDTSIGYTKLRG